MKREEVKKMALSRDCHCVLGKDRDTNFNEVIDKVFDYFESELKQLRVADVMKNEVAVCENCKVPSTGLDIGFGKCLSCDKEL
jgi:hypothetical protein